MKKQWFVNMFLPFIFKKLTFSIECNWQVLHLNWFIYLFIHLFGVSEQTKEVILNFGFLIKKYFFPIE